jgi:hypothetical protein
MTPQSWPADVDVLINRLASVSRFAADRTDVIAEVDP